MLGKASSSCARESPRASELRDASKLRREQPSVAELISRTERVEGFYAVVCKNTRAREWVCGARSTVVGAGRGGGVRERARGLRCKARRYFAGTTLFARRYCNTNSSGSGTHSSISRYTTHSSLFGQRSWLGGIRLSWSPMTAVCSSRNSRTAEIGPPSAPAPAALDITNSNGITDSSCFEVVAIPAKGHGCRATRKISRGERLIAEAPLLTQGPGRPPLITAVEALSSDDRRLFYSLTQNPVRWGDKPTARGVFATNAHPCHEYDLLYRGIFPTIARFNHACDANAVYRWNETLNKLTVHAVRDIVVGCEICVCYSFDGMLREQRQAHLRELFGFICTCAKCSLKGAAVAESDARLARIGDVNNCVRELIAFEEGVGAHQGSYLRRVERLDAEEFCNALEQRHQLFMAEFPPGGHVDGIECFLQAFVELCERAAAKLLRLAERAQTPPNGLPAEALRAKARVYATAARKWACMSLDVARAIKGDDSPAYYAWSDALDAGVWAEPSGSFDFYARWIQAGLARHTYCAKLLA